MSPALPLLSAVLWTASVAVCARSTCVLAVFVLARRDDLFGRVLGWQGASFGLVSATLVSAGRWEAGAVWGIMAAGCGMLRRRERNHGKAQVTR